MLITFADRLQIIDLIGPGKVALLAELGVYKGDFSEHCNNRLQPERHVLIDLWDYAAYQLRSEMFPQMSGTEGVFESYFGGDPKVALADAHRQVVERFRGRPGVEIIRADTLEAASQFAEQSIDFIYLDANHTFEYVLRDLYAWFPKLRPGGLFVLNDYYESQAAGQQNLAVLPAFHSFARRFELFPILLSATPWSDLVFSNRPASDLIDHLIEAILGVDSPVLDVPPEALPSYHHDVVRLKHGGVRLVPSFRATMPV